MPEREISVEDTLRESLTRALDRVETLEADNAQLSSGLDEARADAVAGLTTPGVQYFAGWRCAILEGEGEERKAVEQAPGTPLEEADVIETFGRRLSARIGSGVVLRLVDGVADRNSRARLKAAGVSFDPLLTRPRGERVEGSGTRNVWGISDGRRVVIGREPYGPGIKPGNMVPIVVTSSGKKEEQAGAVRRRRDPEFDANEKARLAEEERTEEFARRDELVKEEARDALEKSAAARAANDEGGADKTGDASV